jgi:peptidyl-prolyl cis-trans isomerase C
MKRRVIIFLGLILFLGLAGCENIPFLKPKKTSQAPPTPAVTVKGTAIARVNNLPITLEDLNQETEAYNAMVGDKPEAKITTREQKINYLKNEMVRRTLLYQDALARGLDRKDEVVQALEKTKRDLLVVQLVQQEAAKVEVTSKEIEDYYKTYKEQLKEPEERQIREIMVSTEQEIKDIMILLLQGQDFATLVRDRSKAPSASNSGDLGFIRKEGKRFSQFEAEAFSDALEVGKTSNIFKGPDGYYIIRLEAKRGGKQMSLSDMWDDIKRGLTFLKQQQTIDELMGRLSREAKIEIYEGEVK